MVDGTSCAGTAGWDATVAMEEQRADGDTRPLCTLFLPFSFDGREKKLGKKIIMPLSKSISFAAHIERVASNCAGPQGTIESSDTVEVRCDRTGAQGKR